MTIKISLPMTLKLECINIYNFKSFKGVHTISGLNDHFTAIVGPNGSGKSNIIDSILFVLGFKAKKMRHAVLKDLINAGCSEAYVELIFNQFTIKRTLRGKLDSDSSLKNVVSKYELDGKEWPSNEIIEYLKERGIDLDNNRFLILQGEIETISMMNPLELLEYVEDCIGSSSFRPRIDSLEHEVKVKQEEVDSFMNNLKFIETDYLFKKGRRDNKLEFLVFRNESLIMKDKIVHMKSLLAERRETALKSERQNVENLLKEISDQNMNSNRKIKEYEKKIEKLDLSTKERELSILRNEFNRIERENKSKEARKMKLERSLEKLKNDYEDNKQTIDGWYKESEILNKKLTENMKEIKNLETEINQKKEQLSSFYEIQEQESQKKIIEKKLMELMSKKTNLLKESNEIKVLEERISILNQNIQKFSNNEDFGNQRISLESEIEQIRRDMAATKQEIAKRKQKLSENDYSEQIYKKEREVLDALKGIKGVYGFLKDLGSYDKKYEEAVEASTKALRNIVVDSAETAEKCISIIMKNKLNRTTFIILDKLSNPQQVDIPNSSNIEVLYKKIKCDEKFVKLFYFAFKDTLCVSDLEEAKKLAFGKIRRKVVTLDGKLLEKSGVMSGGKTSKKLKSAIELEDIYRNMDNILNTKMIELNKFKEVENQKKLTKDYLKELNILKRDLEDKKKKVNFENLTIIDQNIADLRQSLFLLENSNIPAKAIEIKNGLKELNEKLEFQLKLNQEIKMNLGSQPTNTQESLKKEILKIEREFNSIEFDILPDSNRLNSLEEEFNSLYKICEELEEQIKSIRSSMGSNYHQEAQYKSKLEEISESIQDCKRIKQNCILKKNEILNEFSMTRNLLSQIDPSRIANLIDAQDSFEELSDQELKDKSKQMIDELSVKEAENFKKLKSLEKGNEAVEEDLEIYRIIFSEFNQSKKEYDEMKNSTDFASNQLNSMKTELENLKNQRLTMFLDGYNSINKNIKEIFSLITFGGNAELDLLDYLNPFSEGIVLNIMPPKKSWKQISNLSGGEKTLSSLGLIFALHKFKPSCLYIMDEIDAALDYKNVSVISQYLSYIKSQFIIISLRNDMFEMARTLIGVYKYDNISKTVTIDLDKLPISSHN